MVEQAIPVITKETGPDIAWQIPEDFRGIIAYNPRHDIQDYLNLKNLNGKIDLTQYLEKQIQTNNRTRRQLEKAIGERFGVEKSHIEYFVQGSTLKSPDYDEAVIARYKKGQRFLAENGSVETAREDAEVRGIAAVEKIFSQHELRPEQKVIIVSPHGPEGSLYGENYFDVYEEDEDKIEMTRYHSTHSYNGFLKAAQKADTSFENPPEDKVLNAAYFLDKPIITSLSTTEILELFAIDTETQSYRESQEIIAICTPFINGYINTLIENPLEIDRIKKTVNTIFNIADREKQQKDQAKKYSGLNHPHEWRTAINSNITPAAILQAIDYYGTQPVRTTNRGCPGGQRGFLVNQPAKLASLARLIGAKSVIDYAPLAKSSLDDEDEDTSDFNCPDCGHLIKYGAGIKECPDCGKKATCP
jgi:hypothetical protein